MSVVSLCPILATIAAARGPEPKVRRVMMEEVREAAARPQEKWWAREGSNRPKLSRKPSWRIGWERDRCGWIRKTCLTN